MKPRLEDPVSVAAQYTVYNIHYHFKEPGRHTVIKVQLLEDLVILHELKVTREYILVTGCRHSPELVT
ncbi:hypothetical protein SLS54_004715 [Diplodia seriata]